MTFLSDLVSVKLKCLLHEHQYNVIYYKSLQKYILLCLVYLNIPHYQYSLFE